MGESSQFNHYRMSKPKPGTLNHQIAIQRFDNGDCTFGTLVFMDTCTRSFQLSSTRSDRLWYRSGNNGTSSAHSDNGGGCSIIQDLDDKPKNTIVRGRSE
ncbi:hypothetical protein BRADI_3g10336v3 [Brachypodium distachyon]|uniref:Uncharacterized protein n=1 Tax=Brachypodium distachyon TaxID=15368 RepID=A0A2K2CWD7_BRADI|nr:hypothetical protein BRADI_3g10336v3 [Brachypodium distachyon]